MPQQLSGVLLSVAECEYALEAFRVLLSDRTASARLGAFIADLRQKTDASARSATPKPCADASSLATQRDSDDYAPYDLLDCRQAATVLGTTPANVRDLARRGSIPCKRAGNRWLFPAAAIVARAERKASRRAAAGRG